MTARTRTLVLLRGDVRKKADVVGATARHPDSDLTRYINQGAARLRDLLIEIRGRAFFRATPHTFTTTTATRYALPSGFYQLLSLRDDEGTVFTTFSAQDEGALRLITSGPARFYELQDGYVELLPAPQAGRLITLDWLKAHTDLSADADPLEGFDGWEDFVVAHAARCVAVRDAEWELAAALKGELDDLTSRIRKLAPKRDQFRPERVRNVRNRNYR